jgi:hypothetical protein
MTAYPRNEPCEGDSAAPGICPICGYRLFSVDGEEYRLITLPTPGVELPSSRLAVAGDMAICTGCSALLVVAEQGKLAIPTQRSFARVSPSARAQLSALYASVESAIIPAEVCPRYRSLIVPRGDHAVAALRTGDGRLLTSAPCRSYEQALALASNSRTAELDCESKKTPTGWFVRLVLCVFPGRRLVLGVWGPRPRLDEASELALTAGLAMVQAMGFNQLGLEFTPPVLPPAMLH